MNMTIIPGMVGSKCQQCGFMHPPLEGGCPMAKTNSVELNGKEIMAEELFTTIKTLVKSKMAMMGDKITDLNRFKNHISIVIIKGMEDYSE